MKLKDYLQEHGIKTTVFAKKIGVSQPTLSTWLNDVHLPGLKFVFKIEQLTYGHVKVKDWIDVEIKQKKRSRNKKQDLYKNNNESADLEKFPEKPLS